MAAPPTIDAQWVTGVTTTNATLNAEINPNGLLTVYELQIDTTGRFKFFQTDSCPIHAPNAGCATVMVPGDPLPPGLVQPLESSLPAGAESQHVSVDLSSIGATLQLGTTYHYRAIAANSGTLVEGPDQTFTTPLTDDPPATDGESGTTPPTVPAGGGLPAIVSPTPRPAAPSLGRRHAKRTHRCNRKKATLRSARHRRHGKRVRWHSRRSHKVCTRLVSPHRSKR